MNIRVFVGAVSGASVEFFETAAITCCGYKREAIWGTDAFVKIVGRGASL